jgi:predicted RNase H-like HicB family nuclease
MSWYLAAVHKEGKGYGASFPDFPGCIAVGKSFEEVMDNARDALEEHILILKEDKETIPAPSGLSFADESEFFDGAARTLVWEDHGARSQHVRVNITLPKDLIERIDRYAGPRGRSGFLAESARRALDNPDRR